MNIFNKERRSGSIWLGLLIAFLILLVIGLVTGGAIYLYSISPDSQQESEGREELSEAVQQLKDLSERTIVWRTEVESLQEQYRRGMQAWAQRDGQEMSLFSGQEWLRKLVILEERLGQLDDRLNGPQGLKPEWERERQSWIYLPLRDRAIAERRGWSPEAAEGLDDLLLLTGEQQRWIREVEQRMAQIGRERPSFFRDDLFFEPPAGDQLGRVEEPNRMQKNKAQRFQERRAAIFAKPANINLEKGKDWAEEFDAYLSDLDGLETTPSPQKLDEGWMLLAEGKYIVEGLKDDGSDSASKIANRLGTKLEAFEVKLKNFSEQIAPAGDDSFEEVVATATPTPAPTARPTPAPTAAPTPLPMPERHPRSSASKSHSSSGNIVYTISRRDTLAGIASRYAVTVEQLIEANNLQDPNRIFVGQLLLVPMSSRWWIEEVPQSLTIPDLWSSTFNRFKAPLSPVLFGWESGYGKVTDLMDEATDPFVQEFSRLNNLRIEENNQGVPLVIFVKGKPYRLPAGYLIPIGEMNDVLKTLRKLEEKRGSATNEERLRRDQIRKVLLHVASSEDPYKDTAGRRVLNAHLQQSRVDFDRPEPRELKVGR